MLEATEEVVPEVAEGDVRGHMTAREAGEMARGAGAHRLALTHFSDLLDPRVGAAKGKPASAGLWNWCTPEPVLRSEKAVTVGILPLGGSGCLFSAHKPSRLMNL